MTDKFDKLEDFENIDRNKKSHTKNQLQTLKIFAIVFILILSVAISAYILISYFQNNKLSFSEGKVVNSSEQEKIIESQETNTFETNNSIEGQDEQNLQSQSINISDEKSSQPVNEQTNIPKTTSNTSTNSISKTQETTKSISSNETKITQTNKSTKNNVSQSSTYTYTIQIASFTDFDKAISLKNKLEKSGISCYIVIAEIQGKYYYRVRSGKFNSKKDAQQLIDKIKSIDKSLSPIIIQS